MAPKIIIGSEMIKVMFGIFLNIINDKIVPIKGATPNNELALALPNSLMA